MINSAVNIVAQAPLGTASVVVDNTSKVICSYFIRYCIIVTISVMASIPYGVYAACKAAKNESEVDLKMSRITKCDNKQQFSNRKLEYTPVKYNGKMMNSIWGLYNRYSPHNIKKSCDEFKDQQQSV